MCGTFLLHAWDNSKYTIWKLGKFQDLLSCAVNFCWFLEDPQRLRGKLKSWKFPNFVCFILSRSVELFHYMVETILSTRIRLAIMRRWEDEQQKVDNRLLCNAHPVGQKIPIITLQECIFELFLLNKASHNSVENYHIGKNLPLCWRLPREQLVQGLSEFTKLVSCQKLYRCD